MPELNEKCVWEVRSWKSVTLFVAPNSQCSTAGGFVPVHASQIPGLSGQNPGLNSCCRLLVIVIPACKWNYRGFCFKIYAFNFLAVVDFCGCTGLLSLRWARAPPWLWCAGFSLRWLLWLQSTGLGTLASVVGAGGLQSVGSGVVAHRFSCSMAYEVFLGQGLNPCKVDS